MPSSGLFDPWPVKANATAESVVPKSTPITNLGWLVALLTRRGCARWAAFCVEGYWVG